MRILSLGTFTSDLRFDAFKSCSDSIMIRIVTIHKILKNVQGRKYLPKPGWAIAYSTQPPITPDILNCSESIIMIRIITILFDPYIFPLSD